MEERVSLHINTWEKQLAYFIDNVYLRFEPYERVERLRTKRLHATGRKLDALRETERYMTSEQKALAFRERRREAGRSYQPYFTFRVRLGISLSYSGLYCLEVVLH